MLDFNAKMHQNRFRLPDPAEGAYSAPPDPLAGFKGPTSKGREGRGRSTCLPPRFDNPGYGPDCGHKDTMLFNWINRKMLVIFALWTKHRGDGSSGVPKVHYANPVC